ncbi:N-acetylneuraminate synthase [Alicyclobacillus ferrooxydans]|uniref:AFP-like domain-containing protein n=1 Tax=Alicyclobacillus ferrooxydans TaxID=471514 RepID=A0A0P9CEW4_9BACL|nr:N-acetylneuraminate synthase [Alicyclobacillus ferrooxydans]KPV44371.1 hypothetical protein AN477_06985 [Alicyclobacillus ferrooxydans]
MTRCFVIAEIGVNHNGSLETAKKLVGLAKAAGADAVKFQTFQTAELVTRKAKQASYQMDNDPHLSQFDMLERLELTNEETVELKNYAEAREIEFLSSPFDIASVHFLKSIGVKTIKIGSGEITNRFLLQTVADTGLPVILSTGMSSLGEVEQALSILIENDVTLLHCTTSYPTPFESVNLRSMLTLRHAFDCPVGYSDHTEGIEIAVAAVALGATVIEKHLTYDRSAIGPDHKASLEPPEFKAMVEAVRNVEMALGTSRKQCSPAEIGNRDVARKSLVFTRSMTAGDIITATDLTAKRPGYGISSMQSADVIGFSLIQSVPKDTVVTWELLKGAKTDAE